MEQRVRRGDFFQIVSVSSLSIDLTIQIVVDFDDGTSREYRQALTTSGSNAVASKTFGNVEKNGNVVRAVAAVQTGDPKRGEVYAVLRVRDRNEVTVGELFGDYVYGIHIARFPFVTPPGPGQGNGFIHNLALADDVTPVDIEHTLGVANTLRRIDGFIWYYHASGDTATRTLRVSLRDLGDGLPTGMTSGANTRVQRWPSAGTLDLIANQEGTIFVSAPEGKAGFATSSDNGVQTIEDTTTQPIPFPYWAQANDVGEFFFDVEVAQAADRHSIYIIEERWIV